MNLLHQHKRDISMGWGNCSEKNEKSALRWNW